MTLREFFEDLAKTKTRFKWEFHGAGIIRTQDELGNCHCPITAVALDRLGKCYFCGIITNTANAWDAMKGDERVSARIMLASDNPNKQALLRRILLKVLGLAEWTPANN